MTEIETVRDEPLEWRLKVEEYTHELGTRRTVSVSLAGRTVYPKQEPSDWVSERNQVESVLWSLSSAIRNLVET